MAWPAGVTKEEMAKRKGYQGDPGENMTQVEETLDTEAEIQKRIEDEVRKRQTEERIKSEIERRLDEDREKQADTAKVYLKDGRKYWKADNHPLCLNCEHRQEMHHDWKQVQEIENQKTWVQGSPLPVITPVIVMRKQKTYDIAIKPCQHACKCEDYR